jgi:hypothetical protein
MTIYRKRPAPRVKFHITQTIIDTAVRHSSGHCMVADAIRANVPGASHISVDLQTIRWSEKARGLRYTYLTPRIAQDALVKFDRGLQPKPFELSLRGAQVTTMHPGSKGKTGKKKQKPAHKLGRRKLSATRADLRDGKVPEIIGGKPPPRPHPSRRREFGLRAYTLADIVPAAAA